MAWSCESQHLNSLCILCILLLFSTNKSAANRQIHATEYPVDTTVFVNDTVRFTCVIVEPAKDDQILEWYIEWKNDTKPIRKIGAQMVSTISVTDRPEFTGRGIYNTDYSNRRNPSRDVTIHTCNLTISQTTLKDNGYFGCTHQIDATVTHNTLLANKIRLSVMPIESEHPDCVVEEGLDAYNLTCTSRGGIPPASIAWYEKDEVKSETSTKTVTIEVANLFSYPRIFTCRSQQVTLPLKNCSIELNPTFTDIPPPSGGKTSITPDGRLPGSNTTPSTDEVSMTTSLVTTVSAAVKVSGTTPTSQHNVSTAAHRKEVTTQPQPENEEDDRPVIIIGGAVGATVLLLIIIMLLLLLFCRKKTKKQDHEMTPQELPSLDPPLQAVEENPYGNIPGTSGEQVQSDPDELEKPWKNDPEFIMAYQNDDLSSDADSSAESS